MNNTYSTFFHKPTKLSIILPKDWKVIPHHVFDFMALSPSLGNYQNNVGFKIISWIEPLTHETLNAIIKRTRQDQPTKYNAFKEQRAIKKMINQHPVWIQHYTWQEPLSRIHYSQLMCLGVLDENRLLEIHAATKLETEKEILPELLRIMQSFRWV